MVWIIVKSFICCSFRLSCMGLNPTFVSILRNIKGLIYFAPGSWNSDLIKWLKRKYRYRIVGFAPRLIETFHEHSSILNKKPFRMLEYPSSAINHLSKILMDNVSDATAVESILLASCYVTPIVTDRAGLDYLRKYSIAQIYSENALPEREIIRHLRIVDYTILDSHENLCWKAFESIKNACKNDVKKVIDQLIEERKKFAEKDSRRYWRFKREKGELIILYLDILTIIKELSNTLIICKSIDDVSLSLMFGVVPAIKVEVPA